MARLMAGWHGWIAAWLLGWQGLAGWLAAWLAGWLAGCWLAGGLVSWLDGWLTGWLWWLALVVGWLVGCMLACLLPRTCLTHFTPKINNWCIDRWFHVSERRGGDGGGNAGGGEWGRTKLVRAKYGEVSPRKVFARLPG